MKKQNRITFRPARLGDMDNLISMMRALNEDDPSPKPFDEAGRRKLVRKLIGDKSLGRAWTINAGRESVGYIVLALGFSFEYRGRDAFIDELYVAPAFRRQGIGKRALAFVEAAARKRGVNVLHLEVSHDNTAAFELYRSTDYVVHQRHLMSKWFDDREVRGKETKKK